MSMARKKTTTVVEEEVPEEIKNEEIHKESLEDIVAESHGAEIVKDEKTEETPAVETPVEKVEEVKEEKQEPKFDLEENNRKIAEETAKKTREEIADLLKGETKEETKSNKDEYREWAEKFTQEKGKAPEYTDAFEFLEERALTRLEQKQEEARQKVIAEQQAQENDLKAREAQFNKEIDEELAELDKSGKFNSQDPAQRQALFQAMADENIRRVEWNKEHPETPLPIIRSITRIHSNYYKAPKQQPAGADAPVGVGDGGSAAAETSERPYNYAEDHKKPWQQVLKEALTGGSK